MTKNRTLTNPAIIAVATLIAVSGIITGGLMAEKLKDASLLENTEFFSEDFYLTLKNALIMKIIWTIPLILGGVNIVFIPLSQASLFVKCCSYGYTVGTLTKFSGLPGFYTAMGGLLFHNFIFAVISVIYSSYGINKSLECFLNRRNYDYRLRKNKLFAIVTAVFFLSVFLLAVMEAYISLFFYEI